MKFYPEGAVQSVDQLSFGQVVYAGWAYASEPQAYVVVGEAETNKYGSVIVPAYYENRYSDVLLKTDLFPRDLNIGASYNDHFLFTSKAQAQAYINYIKGVA